MNKYLSILIVAGITSVMAADESETDIVLPSLLKKVEQKKKRKVSSAKKDAKIAADKTSGSAKLALITPLFPDTKHLDLKPTEEAIEQFLEIRKAMEKSLQVCSQDSEILKANATSYANLNKFILEVLYADEIDFLGKNLEGVDMHRYGENGALYSQVRVANVDGISLNMLRLLTNFNIVALRVGSRTILDQSTKGLSAEVFEYAIYELSSDIIYLMKKFPSILEANFKLFVANALKLTPFTYEKVLNRISFIQKTDQSLPGMAGISIFGPELGETHKHLPVILRVRSHTTADVADKNKETFVKLFTANVEESMKLFGIEAPKKRIKRSGTTSKVKAASVRGAAPSSKPAQKSSVSS